MNISIILSSITYSLEVKEWQGGGGFFLVKELGGRGVRLTGVAFAQHQRSSE